MSHKWHTVFILLFISLGQMAIDIYLPSLPAMMQALHADTTAVQMTMNTFLVGYAGSQLFYGALADCYGRRPVILCGLGIFCVASGVILFMHSIQGVIILRLVQGIGVGAASVLSRTILRDVFTGKGLATMSAYMGIAWSVVPLVAPVIGGYVQHYLGWRYNFILIFLLGLLAFVLTVLRLTETLPRDQHRRLQWSVFINDYGHILRSPIFLCHIFLLIIMYGTMVAFNLVAPFLFQVKLALTPAYYGWIILLIAAGNIVGSFINARLVQIMALRSVIWCGLVIYMICALALFILAINHYLSIIALIIPSFFMLLASGIVYPSATAASLLPFADRAGSAGALYGFIVIVSGSLVGVIMAYLPAESLFPLASCLLLLGLSGILSFAWFTRQL